MKNFRYLSPLSLEEVFALCQEYGMGTCLLAGGTDLLPRMKKGAIHPACLIDLKAIAHLNGIGPDDHGGLRIGALTSISALAQNPLIAQSYLLLAEAAESIGSPQVRNRGTIGGNLSNASPSADLAPPLLVLGACAHVIGPAGERVVPLNDFFLGPGRTVLNAGEILTAVQVPPFPSSSGGIYLKFSRREGMDLAIVGVACLVSLDREGRCTRARIALGAVAPVPLRATKAEESMAGKGFGAESIAEVSRIAADEAQPISDIRASAEYRREIIRVLVKRALEMSRERAAQGGRGA